MQQLGEILSWLANIIQIGAFVFTIWILWRTRRQLQQHLQHARQQQGKAPVALAVGIGGGIEGAVRQYLSSRGLQMDIVPYTREGWGARDDFYNILRDLLRIKQQLIDNSVTEVHLFYRGPVTLALGLGAIFDDWVPVRIYELDKKAGEYELNLILGKGAVLELIDEIGKEGETVLARHLVDR